MENLDTLKIKLDSVNSKISKIEMSDNNSYTSQLAKSFPLGMVGGSGKNTRSLNKKRERDLNKTIDNAIVSTALYKERSDLENKIQYIESGQKEKDISRKKNNCGGYGRILENSKSW